MPIYVYGSGAFLPLTGGTLTGALAGTTLALGGATIGTHALAVTGTSAFSDGTSGAPSIVFASVPTLGFYKADSSTIQAASNFGATTLRINNGANGIFNSNGLTTTRSNSAMIGWHATNATGAPDAMLTSPAAARIQQGNLDAAAPVAQTLSVQSVIAGTTDTGGASWTFAGSRGTGTGAGGSLIFQVAPAGGSGSAQNALVDALLVNSAGLVQFAGTTSSFPALKRSAAALVARLADDSADATFAAGAGAFSGAVAIGNTLNVVTPTLPDRTVTVVVGGTTIYLHGKTTND